MVNYLFIANFEYIVIIIIIVIDAKLEFELID